MDPVTLALLLTVGTKAVKGIASGIQGRNAAERAEDFYGGLMTTAEERRAEAEAEYQRLREQGLPEYEIGSSYKKYLESAKADPVADYQRRIAAQQEAASLAALRGGGARALLGGLGGVIRTSADARERIEADSGKRLQDALKVYATAEQDVLSKQTSAEQDLYTQDLERAISAANAADLAIQNYQQGLYDANEQRIQANNQFLNTGIDVASTLLGHTEAFGGPGYNSGEKGMKVSKTPGPFSHATNPIHIVRNGRKIGEMTGGEVILNPDQEKKVASQSPYFRQLLRKFNQRNK